MTQRIDNASLLEAMRERMGMGRIAGVPVRTGSPAVQWVIDTNDDVSRLAALFRGHPLPSGSPKQRQFDAWTELMAVRRHLRATRPRRALREAPGLLRVVAEIQDGKRYQGAWPSCDCEAPRPIAPSRSGAA